MRLPRPHPPFRALSTLATVALFVGLSAGSGAAAPGQPAPPAPRTSAQALEQMRAFNEQFEKYTELYNDAVVLLKKRQAEAAAANARVKTTEAAYAALAGQVRRVVVAAYRSVPFAQFGSMLTSGSPQEFLEQSAALNAVARRRAAVLGEAGRRKAAAVKASADAKAAVAAADRLTRELAVTRADLARRAAESKRLFDRLSKQERAAFLARQAAAAAAAERASRSEPRSGGTVSPGSGPPPGASVPASGRAAIAVATARAQLGKPYEWAAAGPRRFDCSGLTMYAWAAARVALPHSSRMQINVGRRVSRSQLQPGDLVFFYSPIRHVGIYVGNGVIIHAPTSNDVVKYASMDTMPFAGASRPG